MPSQFVPAETVRLPLPDGQWVDVKECLNHAEHQRMYEALYAEDHSGEIVRQPFKVGDALVLAYLVEWSFTNLDERPALLRGRPREEREAMIGNLYQDYYLEVKDAIEAHHAAVSRDRAEKKRRRIGADASPTTSPSLALAAGAMSG
jgi:hypothetical protein